MECNDILLFFIDVGFHLIGGDILLTPGQQSVMEATANQDDPYSPLNAVINNEQLLWPDGRVPYVLDSSLSKYIHLICSSYTVHTCIMIQ